MGVKVQMLARWSKLAYKKDTTDKDEAELRRIIDGDEMHPGAMIQAEIIHEHSPVTFDIEEVHHYNRSEEPDYTTLHFKNGDSLVVKIGYYDYMLVDIEHTGKNVHDYLPADYIDPHDNMNVEEDEDLEL